MKKSKVLNVFLSVAGFLLLFIGGSQLLFPVEMKTSSGINVAGNIAVINDIRASNALILSIALVAILGVFKKQLTYTASLLLPVLFLSMGLGRVVSILIDGIPVEGQLGATVLELVLGIVGTIIFMKYREKH